MIRLWFLCFVNGKQLIVSYLNISRIKFVCKNMNIIWSLKKLYLRHNVLVWYCYYSDVMWIRRLILFHGYFAFSVCEVLKFSSECTFVVIAWRVTFIVCSTLRTLKYLKYIKEKVRTSQTFVFCFNISDEANAWRPESWIFSDIYLVSKSNLLS